MASDAIETSMEQPVTQKYIRYRSVRRQNSNNGPIIAPPPALSQSFSPTQNQNVARSMSRYHRRSTPKSQAVPPIPQVQSSTNINPSHAASLAALTGELHSILQSPPCTERDMASATQSWPSQDPTSRGYPSQTTGSSSKRTNQMTIPYGDAKQEARDILTFEQDRMQRLKAQQDALRRIRREEAKQQQMELAKIEEQNQSKETATREQIQTTPEIQPDSQSRPKRRLVIGESINKAQTATAPIVSKPRSDADTEPQSNGIINSTFKSLRHNTSASIESPRKRKLVIGSLSHEQGLAQKTLPPNDIKSQPALPAADQRKPQAFDAPISAVNAGERRVIVKCKGSSIALPVTPTTRAQDLLNSASVVMSEKIDPRTAVLIESFTQLGLERPIRRYEYVRDVLNSWDHDDQNVFEIMPHSERPEILLEAAGAPRSSPKEGSFTAYHSQKPGKWNTRCINLRSDGQMTVSKKEGDSEATNICHLSDFDIYSPTRKQMKKIKSPKKICFAIKSQQKSAMFLDSAAMNFVHFVSTNDWELGESLYLAIQSWRSWYLLVRLGEGQKAQAKPANALEAMQRPGTASSAQSIPYQLGSFQPLLDFDLGQLNLNLNNDGTPRTQDLHMRNMSSRDRRAPPSAFPDQRREDVSVAAVTTRGRVPSINGRTGSMNSNVDQPTNLVRSTSLNRSGSTRQKPKPLVDITSQFKEAPQHFRIGRGVKALDGQPLVGLATDVAREPGAIVVPPANDWRRPETRSPAQNTDVEDQAFTGKGLLSRAFSKRTQGASRSGHAVKGSDGKPLVHLTLNSQFAEGSLLRQVEAWKGEDERGLVVDREKRVERTTKVGEGY